MHITLDRFILLFYGLLLITSCTLFKPLPLKPINNPNAIPRVDMPGLSSINGNYNIISTDSNASTLEYALLYSELTASDKSIANNAYISLEAIDARHIKANYFINNKMVKERMLKGRFIDNYFEFYSSHLKFRFIINVYTQQTNRIALSKENDLFLDTNRGGIGFLLFLPIPLSGSSFDTYNLKFKRK